MPDSVVRVIEGPRLTVEAVQVHRLDIGLGERRHQKVRAPETFGKAAVAADVLVAALAPLGDPHGLALRLRKTVSEIAEALEAVHRARIRLVRAVTVVDDVGDLLHDRAKRHDEARGI